MALRELFATTGAGTFNLLCSQCVERSATSSPHLAPRSKHMHRPERIIVRSFNTPFGELMLGAFGDALCSCDWRHRRMRTSIDARLRTGLNAEFEEGLSPVLDDAMRQLNAYFNGDRRAFDVPLRLVGTPFQISVWEALREIPFGSTTTYALLSDRVAVRTAIRAVAAANGANAISIIVPCHRVVGSDGSLVGYAGGLEAKRRLLQLEGASVAGLATDLFSALAD